FDTLADAGYSTSGKGRRRGLLNKRTGRHPGCSTDGRGGTPRCSTNGSGGVSGRGGRREGRERGREAGGDPVGSLGGGEAGVHDAGVVGRPPAGGELDAGAAVAADEAAGEPVGRHLVEE